MVAESGRKKKKQLIIVANDVINARLTNDLSGI
jgi:hypothetical protein